MKYEDYETRFKQALGAANPEESLRQIALELKRTGKKRQEVFDLFYRLWRDLSEPEDEDEQAIAGDVLDMISQFYPGKNLEIPE
jgi:hypothetical protein